MDQTSLNLNFPQYGLVMWRCNMDITICDSIVGIVSIFMTFSDIFYFIFYNSSKKKMLYYKIYLYYLKNIF